MTKLPKFLFLNFPALGHVNPTMAIASELRSFDADVVYALPESFREQVETAGATLAPLAAQANSEYDAADGPDDYRLALLPYLMAAQSQTMVPALLEIIERHQPDCLLINSLYLWGRLAALFTGTPAAAFRPYHAPRAVRTAGPPYPSDEAAQLADTGETALDRLCWAYNKPKITLDDLTAAPDPLTLMFMPKEFQHAAEEFDNSFRFVGPCLPALRRPQNFFSLDVFSQTKKIYISQGSMRTSDVEFYKLCLSAFQSLDWIPTISTGPHITLADIGPIPGHTTVAPFLPQLSILAEADIFITHGGLNSTMEALAYGVPLIVIPTTREQRLTARRIRDLGLGVMLERQELTAEELRQTARQVAADRSIKTQLHEMQKIIRDAGGATAAAEALLDFVAR